jgi:Ice-binding-like
VWIFQITSSLVTSPYTSFILQNGAQAKNVYWTVGSSATIGYSSSFVGNILAYASISFGKSSVLNGRGLAGAGVTFAGDSSVTQPAL